MMVIGKLLVLVLIAGSATAAPAQKSRKHERAIILETPLRERFYREKTPQEYILYARQKIGSALRGDFGRVGYNLHWNVPADCIPATAKRYRGLFPDEILAKIGIDYNLKFKLYQNKNIEVTPLYVNPLSICARNLRVNLEGG